MNKRRILLIDDEETFADTMKLYLEKTGCFTVRVEYRGDRGIVAAKEFLPELIILDVIMPDQDGGAIAAQLKEEPELRKIPIVFLTAVVSREEARTQAGLIGGQLFIPKPMSAKDVLAIINQQLGMEPWMATTSDAGVKGGR